MRSVHRYAVTHPGNVAILFGEVLLYSSSYSCPSVPSMALVVSIYAPDFMVVILAGRYGALWVQFGTGGDKK